MILNLYRFSTTGESTIGLLFVDEKFECYSLEDTRQEKKAYGKTRIPEGRYKINLRAEGGMHQRYSKRYGSRHHGMLWLRSVPGFEYIYIHPGNTDDDTQGCILVGDRINNNTVIDGFLGASRPAYERVYKKVAPAIQEGMLVEISVGGFPGL